MTHSRLVRWGIPVAIVSGVVACVLPGAAPAQAVLARVVDQATGEPVAGALVALLTEQGAPVVEGITTPRGLRLLAAGPGVYRVRVRRIGYAPTLSAPVTIGLRDTTDLELRVAGARVLLPTVSVRDRASCERRRGGGAEVAVLWEEIQKALTASELTRTDTLVAIQVRNFERWLDRGGKVLRADTTPTRISHDRPFTALSPDELSRGGYVRDTAGNELRFYAPDAAVLLSDEFARDHCFGVVAGPNGDPGLVGLSFRPVRTRRLPDIAGVLWVDRTTAELRRLEFRYVNTRLPFEGKDMSGWVVFDRLPSGAWIIRDWLIRMPLVGRAGARARIAYRVGLLDAGGFATVAGGAADTSTIVAGTGQAAEPGPGGQARQPVDRPPQATPTGALGGVVFDSLAGAPLAGATVWLHNSLGSAVTDARARYQLDSVPAGRQLVAFSHPELDSAGVTGLPAEAHVLPGVVVRLDLATPSFDRLHRAACPRGGPRPGTGYVYGMVRDAERGVRLAGATVVMAWLAIDTTAKTFDLDWRAVQSVTDSTGVYRACEVPVETSLTVQAAAGGFASGETELAVGARRVARRDLSVSREAPPPADSARAAGTSAAPEPRGVAAAPVLRRGRAALAGTVRDERGAPLRDARASVEGAAGEALTGESGRFVLAGQPAGSQTLVVRLLGYGAARVPVELHGGDTARLDVTLRTAVVLGAMNVTAPRLSRVIQEIERRRKLGFGYVLMGDDVTKRPHVWSVLQGAPGVTVIQRRGEFGIFMERGGRGCVPTLVIDGRKQFSTDMLASYRPEDLVAVEVYRRAGSAPGPYGLGDCGVILVWTRSRADRAP